MISSYCKQASSNCHNQSIRPNAITPRCLDAIGTCLRENKRSLARGIRRDTIDLRPRNHNTCRPIRDRHNKWLSLSHRSCRGRNLQKEALVESVESPEHVVQGFGLELATADRGELVVDEQAPKLRGRLRRAADGRDEEVVEFRVKGAVKGEFGELRGRVEGVGGGISGSGVGAEVGAVAEVSAARSSRYVAWAGEDGGFVDGVCEALYP